MLALFDEEDRPSKQDLSKYLEQLADEYDGRGIFLKEVASGFRFQARSGAGLLGQPLMAGKAAAL